MATKYFRNSSESKPSKGFTLNQFVSPPKGFLAEGPSEAYFFEALFERRGYAPSDYVVFCYRGNTKLRRSRH